MSRDLDTSASRQAILGNIKRALHQNDETQAVREQTIAKRIADHARGIIPKHSQISLAKRCDLFILSVEQLSGSTTRVKSAQDIPAAIADYLRKHNLPAEVRAGSDARLQRLDWARTPNITVNRGPARDKDKTCLTHAVSGVAETGTLVLVSGADNPTSLNFMPDHSIVVVEADTIDASYEDGFDRIRKAQNADPLPRSVNLITGPSRTADIEQVIHFGAHGPKHLHVILVG